MIVTLHLKQFYNWDPVPDTVVVTKDDVASGKVMPGRDGGFRMKVVKKMPTHRTITVAESSIIAAIIVEKADPRRAGRTFTRNEAVAQVLQEMQYTSDQHGEWDWITDIEVHDDGPSEELVRDVLKTHSNAPHGRRLGRMNVPPEHVEDHVKKYLGDWTPMPTASHADPEKPTAEELLNHAELSKPVRVANNQKVVDHLKAHFGVRR
jgi:hypothetical protein